MSEPPLLTGGLGRSQQATPNCLLSLRYAMLYPPSGTGCQTHYKMQQTLHLFGSSEISGSSLPISIRQFPVALLVSHDSFACRTNNVSFAAQHNVVKNNNNNHVLFYVLFLRIGAHRALQSKEGEKKTSVSVHVCAHTHIHVRLRTRTRTYACAHTHMYMCTCMHTHIHMLVHARAHTHTHTVNSVMVFFMVMMRVLNLFLPLALIWLTIDKKVSKSVSISKMLRSNQALMKNVDCH